MAQQSLDFAFWNEQWKKVIMIVKKVSERIL